MTENKKIKKKIFESSSLNAIFLNLSFIIGIFTTFLIVRLISPEEWATIILALSILNFAVFICGFFPPGATSTITYYIPRLLAENEKVEEELLSFVYYNYKNRFFYTVIIYILFLIIISLLNIELQLFQIIIIVSPMIFFNNFQNLNLSILLAFQKFRRLFWINILNILIFTVCLFMIFIFQLKIPLILITFLNLLNGFSTFLTSFLSILPLLNIKNKNKKKISIKDYKQKFNELQKKYGLNVIVMGLISQAGILILNFLYLNSGVIIFITYIAIGEKMIGFVLNTSNSKQSTSIFSELYVKSKSEFKSYFINFLKYSLLLSGILVGLLFFFIEVFFELIYTETYFVIIFAIKVFVLITFSRIILRSLGIITFSTNNTIISVQMNIIQVTIHITSTAIAILFFNFEFLIILYVISSYFYSFISFLLNNHYTKLNLNIITIYKPTLLIMASLLITIIISSFVNIQIFSGFEILNLLLNSIIKFSIFLFLFYIAIYFTRYITKEEFDKLIEIIPILNSKKRFILRIVKITRKFIPSKREIKVSNNSF